MLDLTLVIESSLALICSKTHNNVCLFVCHAVTQLTNPWTACLLRERGQISAPVWQGGTSHSVSMVISRCHSPWRRSEGFLTSVRKRGSLHCTPPPPLSPMLFFPCWVSSGNRSDREKESGIRERDRESCIGGQGGPSPQPGDAAAKALAMESPIQLHGRERAQQKRFREEGDVRKT